MNRTFLFGGVLFAAASFGACTGTIGGEGEQVSADEASLCVVDTPIRRLTRFEYNNTVRDLFGDTTEPASAFPPEEEVAGFNNQAQALTTSELLIEQYMKAAEAISERAVTNLATLLPDCDPVSDGDEVCADQFFSDIGRKAFRRPLSEQDTARLRALFDWGMAEPDIGTFAESIRLVIEAMLQSPHFLYRPEFGGGEPLPDSDVVELDDWEIATKLSYMLWNSMPDDELFAAASAGELSTKEQIAQQARRMLDDDKARDLIGNFHEQWLLLTHVETIAKDPAMYPGYDDSLRGLWKEEVDRFIEYAIMEDDGTLDTLLTANYSFMNEQLASFYGDDVTESVSGDELRKVSVDPTRRAGLLTTGAVMATHAKANQSSPVYRGKFVREQLLCQTLPPPPNDLIIEPPELDSSKTTREQFEEISADQACASCHNLMNPVGFIFEHYDGAGLWRDTQNGKPIDATAEIINSDLDRVYDGAVDLAGAMAESEQVAQCVALQWMRFSYNRSMGDSDACMIEPINQLFAASGYDIKQLLVELSQTNTFRMRHQVVVEGGGQ